MLAGLAVLIGALAVSISLGAGLLTQRDSAQACAPIPAGGDRFSGPGGPSSPGQPQRLWPARCRGPRCRGHLIRLDRLRSRSRPEPCAAVPAHRTACGSRIARGSRIASNVAGPPVLAVSAVVAALADMRPAFPGDADPRPSGFGRGIRRTSALAGNRAQQPCRAHQSADHGPGKAVRVRRGPTGLRSVPVRRRRHR